MDLLRQMLAGSTVVVRCPLTRDSAHLINQRALLTFVSAQGSERLPAEQHPRKVRWACVRSALGDDRGEGLSVGAARLCESHIAIDGGGIASNVLKWLLQVTLNEDERSRLITCCNGV